MQTRQGGRRARTSNGTHPNGASPDVQYPERDGKPMGETETHIREIMRLIQTLDGAFAGRPDVYVGGDLLVYYQDGNPRSAVVPAVFVAVGAPKLPQRRIYKLWEEAVPPTFVIEVTSPSTRHVDLGRKRELYAQLGLREYVLYDPLGEYLRPALQGFRLDGGVYQPMAQGTTGALISEALGLYLQFEDGRLRLRVAETGAALLDPLERAVLEAERAALATARADTAEKRIAELEAELRRLRGEG